MARACPVLASHYEELSSFLAAFPDEANPRPFWLERFLLWWDHNPAFAENLERGWVLRKNGAIVGFCGMIPSKFQQHGQEEVAFSATTWRVLPEHRSESLSLLFKLIHASKHTVLFCTTPGDVTASVLKALKFQLLPRSDNLRSIVPINFQSVVNAQFGGKRTFPFLEKAVARGLAFLQSARLRLAREDGAGMEVRELQKADPAFDKLWDKTKGLYPNTNVRTAEVVNWFCFGNQHFEKQLFGCYQHGELLGYAVCRVNAANKSNLKVLECVDLWPGPAGDHLLESLVRGVKAYAQEHLYDVVAFPHFNREIGCALKKLGLMRVKDKERREYFKVNTAAGGEVTACNSYFVTAQGDNGL